MSATLQTLPSEYGVNGLPEGISETEPEMVVYEVFKVQCPECESKRIEYYPKRDEEVCRDCGLVLSGPPAYSGLQLIYYPLGNRYSFKVTVYSENYGGMVDGRIS